MYPIFKTGLKNIKLQKDNVRAQELFEEHKSAVYEKTDRLFAILLPLQWLFGIAGTYLYSPLIWDGSKNIIHPQNWIMIFVGGLILSVPLYFIFKHPGQRLTRTMISISQMLMCALLTHLTGGRIETHFYVFSSLAFLSFYRDWRLLIPATIVTGIDHLFRGWFYPFAVYGVYIGGEWRWAEHFSWIIFENLFLVISCRRGIREMWEIAVRTCALETSEERYQLVLEQNEDAIVLFEPKTLKVIECNEVFSSLLGFTSTYEVKTLTVYDLILQETADNELTLSKFEDEKAFLSGEKNYRCFDGSFVTVEVSVNLIQHNGKQLYWTRVKDITHRKKTEEELKILALVVQKTQNAVIITDSDGVITWVNDGFINLTKYDIDEVLGQHGYFLQGEKTNLETVETIRVTMWARQPYVGEIYSYTKDGKGFWMSISITPIRDNTNEVKGFIAIQMDISEFKAIEEELRRSQDDLEGRVNRRTNELVHANEAMKIEVNERKKAEIELNKVQQFLLKVIDTAPSLIFVKDVEGRFTLANKALAELYGTTKENLIGKTDADFNDKTEETEQIAFDDQQVLENLQEKFIFEEKLTDSNGKVRWLQTVKRPLIFEDGKSNFVLGIATDLTERKELENRLRRSQKMESIGQLASGIAHEINTPTQYVSDNTRFIRDALIDINFVLKKYEKLLEAARANTIDNKLLEEVEDEIERRDIAFISNEAMSAVEHSLDGVLRIGNIVKSMRVFSHPGTVEKNYANLNKAIESAIIMTNNQWKYVAEMETHFDENLPLVPCLLDQFNQVILNMIINAVHTITDIVNENPSEGLGKITISTKAIDNVWAEIRISDTGAGIPTLARERIFDPFYTTKEIGKGTGQGLAISHTIIVEKHNGQLDFETELGLGTTFIIRLPLTQEFAEHHKQLFLNSTDSHLSQGI